MDDNKLELLADVFQSVHIGLDPSWVIQDKSNHPEYLRASARWILSFNFSKAAVDNETKIIVSEETSLGLLVNH